METTAQVIRKAINEMRADRDVRWHAVADLLAGGPLGYAEMARPERYSDAKHGAEVARSYLAALPAD